ncbi:MAG: ribosome maturation factor RimM [Treponema sp.]|nr:ribosome maturation factor RimM [Treponema sp.]
MTEHFAAGLVGAPFGIKGFVKVRSLSGEYGHLERLKNVVLRKEHEEKFYEIEETVALSKSLAVKFAGVDTPEEARLLSGAEFIISREEAAPLKAGEFYVEDLRFLEVFCAGEKVGDILDVVEGGGGSLVEIRLLNGEKRFAPFRNEFFGVVDIERNRAELLRKWILE